MAIAADHAVGGALLLDLDHRAFAGRVWLVGALRDYSVERLAASREPFCGDGGIGRRRGEAQRGIVELVHELHQRAAALGERPVGKHLLPQLEAIEQHQQGGSLARKLVDP